jgi:type I restriction enzyme R subunit
VIDDEARQGRTFRSLKLARPHYLSRAAVSKRLQAGHGDDTPEEVNTPGRRALFNNLGKDQGLALRIDARIKELRPDGWRGVPAREQVIKGAIYEALKGGSSNGVEAEVERIFLIVKQQREY